MDYTAFIFTVILALLFAIPGFIMGKIKMANPSHLKTLSAILVYVCGPCMVISSFINIEFTWYNLGQMGLFLLVSLAIQIVFMMTIYFILKKKYDNPAYRVFTIGTTLGNVGFFGLPVVTSLMPDEPIVAAYSSIFVLTMNILVFTVGTYCLTNDKSYMKLRNTILNPTAIAAIIAMPLYIFGVKQYIPSAFYDGFALLGKMTTPVCMIILGVRLSQMSFKVLFLRVFPYITSLFKLIIFPLFAYLVVYFLPLTNAFKASIFILAATPCASVILNMAEMYDGEKELAANCVLISTILCVGTIPLMGLILNLTL